MRITADLLRYLGACKPKYRLWRKIFGDAMEPTVENLVLMGAHDLEPGWLYDELDNRNIFQEGVYDTLCRQSEVMAKYYRPDHLLTDLENDDRDLRIMETDAAVFSAYLLNLPEWHKPGDET